MAWSPSRVSTLAALLALTALFGCGDDGGGGGPFDPEFDLAVIVEGTVFDIAAQPIFGVTIRITAYVYSGSACTTELVGPPATTNVTEEGSFSKTVGFEGPTDDEIEACLTVEALPQAGYFPESRSIRAEIRPLDEGVEVVQVALVLEPTPP
jgi:hypothetical protein